MFPLPISTYIYAGLILFGLAGFGYGKYESNKYDAYKLEIATIAAKQEAKNEAIAKEQTLINKATKETYEAKLSAIKSYYGGLHNPGSSSMPKIPNATSGTNGSTPDLELACAYTTQQLVSLQDWITQQLGVGK